MLDESVPEKDKVFEIATVLLSPIDKVPELPYEKCTTIGGCRCNYLPVIK